MSRLRFLIVGGGGRESIFASRLAEDTELYAVIPHKNPSIIDCVRRSGGRYTVGDSDDPQTVLRFAIENKIEYAFVNADQPLANGVVDVLLENGFKAIGGTREAARIEWDKIYSIEMMQKTCPEFTPFYMAASDVTELHDAVEAFESRGMQIVVKPQGLTGGKGVKVMPEHLPEYSDCIKYATSLLKGNPDERVLLVEKLHGIEFTIMGITDGTSLVMSPASYDYPFRLEDDRGAGTGGMGCFTSPEKKLPFMTDQDLDDCAHIMQRIIDEIRRNGLPFNGVLNGGFFKTVNGIRFMEFNGRFGDPEGLNILSVLDGSLSEMLIDIWNKTLSEMNVKFARKASVVKYLVAPEYPEESNDARTFCIDEKAVAEMGVNVFFASCVGTSHQTYETLKKSRVVAFVALSESIGEASERINAAIDAHVSGGLQYRRDIGSEKSLAKIERANAEMSIS